MQTEFCVEYGTFINICKSPLKTKKVDKISRVCSSLLTCWEISIHFFWNKWYCGRIKSIHNCLVSRAVPPKTYWSVGSGKFCWLPQHFLIFLKPIPDKHFGLICTCNCVLYLYLIPLTHCNFGACARVTHFKF